MRRSGVNRSAVLTHGGLPLSVNHSRRTSIYLAIVTSLSLGTSVAGQSLPAPETAVASRGGEVPFAFDGPPAPMAPAVVARDEAGRVTIRAVRLDAPLRLDGALDEALYRTVPSISDLVQVEPDEGAPATEKTEIWLAFDGDHVYVSFRCWDSEPERRIATEMRRDSGITWNGNDLVSVFFDTFYDRRNGIGFTINSIGGRNDGQITNERQYAADWNPIWDFAVGRFDGGWTVEMAIPFKSLRYREGEAQVWGFNALRAVRWKNELSLVTRIPAGRGMGSVQQSSMAATLVGVEAPASSRNLDIKPYATMNATSASGCAERPHRRRRLRPEVRPRAEPERGRHLQHRLRTGGGRRGAGQPDALQSVLPRKARVLPREPGDVFLRWHSPRPATTPAATRRCCSTAGASAWIRGVRCRSRAAAV